ncbi:RNA pseudouridine synthase [Aerococcaceae bacterium DSM 109653]|uniref:RNA pseudouridylate synthase n=1 Tax=Fundicoccus ignavus TaxID=2664442 RepID=A0A844BLC2_9LACT|nr:RNA pseudouridine synthase [Fundicoccus ignavus]MRI80948.1 RNA pseudouridine synthase [Fundicoccus ignavus]
MKVPILYEDNHLLLVEKPVNIPVQSDKSGDQDLLSHLKNDIKIRFQKPGNVYLGLVHRLDRPVGGAMVFAKTSKAASRLSDQVRRNSMERQYYAVVHGRPAKKAGQLVDYLWKNTQKNIVSIVPKSHKEGKKALLNYQVLETQGALSLLAVQLETGRPHQIRVQLAGMGTPIWGDQKYGARYSKVGQQIALWARSLSLEHPVKKDAVRVDSQPPQSFPWDIWSKI